MPALKLDDNNDLAIENNNLVLIDGSDLVKQLIIQRLKTFLGEWFLDKSVGIPYFQDILIKNPNANVVTTLIKNEILKAEGVIELDSFSTDFNDGARQLSISFSVRTEDGIIRINNFILGELV
jgi:hypothetical protein